MTAPPELTEFRLEFPGNGLVHVVFDAPGRTMNVFSEAAIVEIGRIARWLEDADVRGALIRSAKTTGFCAGANLPEIWAAYDMIMATPGPRRLRAAYDHFFRLSLALRALETCGKPVACAIAGLALGGGGELALASHYRVLTDDRRAAIGLPESLVGLLPGAGGTQRLPRLVGIERAMPLLLQGKRLSGAAAVEAGVAHRVVTAGEEVAAAEDWLLSSPAPVQPWDREDWIAAKPAEVSAGLGPIREAAIAASLGHYPATFAILDCVEFGLPQSFEGAIRSEMTSFSRLLLRPEPRAMIQTMFLGRIDYERLERRQALPDLVAKAIEAVKDAVTPLGVGRSDEERRVADYAAVTQGGYPAVLAAALVGYPDSRLGERACAFLILRPGESLDLRAVQDYMAENKVAKQYWPERIEIVDDLPKTPAGKIQKFQLREKAKAFGDVRAKVSA